MRIEVTIAVDDSGRVTVAVTPSEEPRVEVQAPVAADDVPTLRCPPVRTLPGPFGLDREEVGHD